MAMLAEPRQRKRYNLVPKGKALYEDDSRFGTKMLEKMGWSKGKGLGAKEDGSLDFVRVKYKNDIQGLGFEQRDDQWTQHESSFNGLLSSLNEEEDNSKINDESARTGFGFQIKTLNSEGVKMKEKTSGESLEEKSKQSKARVHYKKFTRGKDLSQYSEKDLANIFGKKSIDDQEEGCSSSTDVYDQLNKYICNGADNKKEAHQIDTVTENFSGVQTISTGLSVTDYFKEKMAALKYRRQRTQEKLPCVQEVAEQASKRLLNQNKEMNSKVEVFNVAEDNDIVIQADFRNKDVKRKRSKKDGNTIGVNAVRLEECMGDLDMKPAKMKKIKNCIHFEEPQMQGSKSSCSNRNIETNKDLQKSCIQDEAANLGYCKSNEMEKAKQSILLDTQPIGLDSNKERDKMEKKKRTKKLKILDNSIDNTQPEAVEGIHKFLINGSKAENAVDYSKDLSLKDLATHLSLFNVYRLSSFCAEKFRNLNLSFFPEASLAKIKGYGLNQDIQLKIETIKTDEMRITKLWDNTLSKYALMEKDTKKAYQKYVKESYKAKKFKQKKPSLHFKTWKRKNAFAVI